MLRLSSARLFPALVLLAFGFPTVCSAPRRAASPPQAGGAGMPAAAPAPPPAYDARPADEQPAPTSAPAEKPAAAPAAAADGGSGPSSSLFQTSVRPILATRCAPCHNPGGKMYARLPFDDPAVVAAHSAGVSRRLKGDDLKALERWLESR